ncbi:MAG TPA: serine hydroxymethyltransferase [Acidimicrobiia bacterium]|jgi:glycine hydroxymethyltransferase|nr:serine hydroxymethyltransferase [Acidimicrobiia bacterium]
MISMDPIEQVDPAVAGLIRKDLERQNSHIHLIASENFASPAVMAASGSVFTNKYAEGYPGRRYYEGCQVVDEMEQLAIDRAKELFGAEFANVQAHSGAQANMGAYFSLIEPGDTVLGMRLDQGGHLTHGSPVNFSGLYYNFVAYGVDPDTELIDMDEVRRLAKEHRPKILLAGYSAYSRTLDYTAFREIADDVGAVFMVDAAHFIGLVAGKSHPSPVPHADIVTGTTHKALRGPRGGLVLATEPFGEKINKAVFPNVQGGPIESQVAAKAVCFHEAMQPGFHDYTDQIVANARAMATRTQEEGVRVVSGGTDNHLYLIDLRSVDEDLTGKDAARMLDGVGITLNFNTIPFDPRPPYRASGLRIGTPAMTTQGMREEQAAETASLICRALAGRGDQGVLDDVARRVSELAAEFSPYPHDFAGHV